ncbi:MAG: TAT-variant-translocated molybdopterin oxidoreductase [Verrucomicrobia bacterium]|nr:TAT-variant-translocated molybdopterin oxidoreductase [Verrucomicrobiota bacterium]
MKTIPPPCPEPESGPKYWRSLDQLADTPEFRQWVEREFPAGASEFTDPVSRRHFVKIMSASFLLAGLGLTGCRRPEENILPFSKMPENYTHGVPQFFATAMPVRGSAIPLLAKSHEGRPTKIEGNPQHPDGNGSTDAFAQASILNLYDPDRATRFAKNGNNVSRDASLDFLADLSKQAQANGGQGLSVLLERSSSPSRARLQKLIGEKLPKAGWHVYEPVDFDIHREAATLVTGKSVAPYFKLDTTKVIVSLDCDFIGTEENAHINIRRFAQGRRIEKPTDSMSRLYAVEGLFTLTGANADHRLRIPTSAVLSVAARLALEIRKEAGQPQFLTALSPLAEAAKAHEKWIAECAKDLLANRGQCLVLAGQRQPLAAHLIANAINAALENHGKTVVFHDAPQTKEGGIAELAQSLNAGQVQTLIVLGGNPVYNAPADLKWGEAQSKAKTVVRLGYYEDESFPANGWHLPQAHFLESWGDARTADGTVVSIQPLIKPLFDGLTELEVLARLGGLDRTNPYDIVRETFKGIGGEGEDNWKKFLHDGFLAGSAAKPVTAEFNWSATANVVTATKPVALPSKDSLEIVFHRDAKVDDGRYNNNGWLQELPDPITKMTWENVILLSLKTAVELGVIGQNEKSLDHENNDLKVPWVKIQVDGREIEGPVWIQPGLADNTLGLALGYGRKQTGRVGRGSGYDAFQLRTSAAPHVASGAKLVYTSGATHPLSTTQNHWSMEGRPVVREANLTQYREHPEFAKNMKLEEPPSTQPLYPNPLDSDKIKERAIHWWGMSVDLNACVGCSACMMACQSENNIPIVGKEQVGKNREMHWIRIDRYYSGEVTDPQAVTQPMLCQHCESAPCESVCPVNATVHDEEGLNVMVYNRCVGTRYCSNNCPYKVRRFNYFDYNKRPLDQLYKSPVFNRMDGEWGLLKWWKDVDKGTKREDEWELMKLVRNPDVTVRMRGVMEKCTFCLQRIEQAKIAQKVKAGASGDVEVPDGTIKTACQQACPAEAIVFGNIKDPSSHVSRLKAQERDYKVLDFLATRPRTTYLARLRNPNPAMPDYRDMPLSLKEYTAKNGSPFETHGGEHGAAAGHEHTSEKGAH